MEDLIRDLRHALRTLGRAPLFAGVAILTLGLGLGVNATIFTFVNSVLLRPLPIENIDEVVSIYTTSKGESFGSSSLADFEDLEQRAGAFERLAGHGMAIASLQHEGRSEIVIGEMVTGGYFDLLGVGAQVGRALQPADDQEGQPRVVVLGHGLWQRRFGGDPEILGRTARLNGELYEVVGVLPESFTGLTPGLAADYWLPTVRLGEIDIGGQITSVHNDPGTTLRNSRGYRWMWIKARLRDGTDPASAEAQVQGVMAGLESENPITNEKIGARLVPASSIRIHPEVDKVIGPAATVLMLAVGLVLAIVCANLANMLLSRAESRRREIAVRLALGAGRWRLVRQLVAESLLISGFGCVAALLFATWTSKLLVAYQPPIVFSLNLDAAVDVRVALFTVLVAASSTLLFALVPALQASRPELVPALKAGAQGSSHGAGRIFSMRNLLVISQVAVSMILLVCGGLLARGAVRAAEVDVGLDTGRVAAVLTSLEMHGYEADEAQLFVHQLRERTAAMPGVESAAFASRVPFDLNKHHSTILPASMDLPQGHEGFSVDVTWVDEHYFATVGVPVLSGRAIERADIDTGARVAVINETAARRFWSSLGPREVVGQRLYRGGLDTEPFTVVGVSRDHKVSTVGEGPTPYVHFAMTPSRNLYGYLLARSAGGDATPLAGAIRGAALELDPELAFGETTTVERLVDITLFPVRMGAALLGLFGVLALLLAGVGLYGVLAYAVSQRQRELALRMALGARPREVLVLVLRGGLLLVGVGCLVGGLLANGLGRLLSGVLYGGSSLDPLAYAGAALVLGLVALVANLLPALRAARTDPLLALKEE